MKWLATAACTGAIGLVAAGCGSSSGKHTAKRGSPRPSSVSLAQISAARRSNELFKLFAARTAYLSCSIPRGGPASPGKMTLPGTCSTHVRYAQKPQATVIFTERWHEPGGMRWWQHTWEVVVSSTAKVLSTVSLGTPPPQLWS